MKKLVEPPAKISQVPPQAYRRRRLNAASFLQLRNTGRVENLLRIACKAELSQTRQIIQVRKSSQLVMFQIEPFKVSKTSNGTR